MKFSTRVFIVSLQLFTVLILIESCNKKDNMYSSTAAPRISSFMPNSGAMDAAIVISGANFSESLSGNIVAINGVPAVVTAATATSITIKVPAHAGDGKITVQVGGQTASSTGDFTYMYTVSTLAGNGNFGFREGSGTNAEFNAPDGLAVDGSGNIYVADAFNNRIRKISASGDVSTFAGDGTHGFKDGTGTSAEFYYPNSLTLDGSGNLYVADTYNQRIRKITTSAEVSTLAGSGTFGFKDGAGNIAQFEYPIGMAIDGSGNIYVGDVDNHRVRKITAAGEVSTFAGDGNFGFKEGAVNIAEFKYPSGIAMDASGNIYVGDADNNRVRKITTTGEVSTVAGNNIPGFNDGLGTSAQFYNPGGLAVDASGNIYVADYLNNRIRKITPAGIVSTLAGDGNPGFKEGSANIAEFNYPVAVAMDGLGNIYVADQGNYRVRKLE